MSLNVTLDVHAREVCLRILRERKRGREVKKKNKKKKEIAKYEQSRLDAKEREVSNSAASVRFKRPLISI